ncbi:hypothetical protein [Ekhidna sp.]
MKIKYHQLESDEEIKIIVGRNEKLRVICYYPVRTLGAYSVKNGTKDPDSYYQLNQNSWSPAFNGNHGYEIILHNSSSSAPVSFSTVIDNS